MAEIGPGTLWALGMALLFACYSLGRRLFPHTSNASLRSVFLAPAETPTPDPIALASVKELKARLEALGGNLEGIVEKEELVRRVREAQIAHFPNGDSGALAASTSQEGAIPNAAPQENSTRNAPSPSIDDNIESMSESDLRMLIETLQGVEAPSETSVEELRALAQNLMNVPCKGDLESVKSAEDTDKGINPILSMSKKQIRKVEKRREKEHVREYWEYVESKRRDKEMLKRQKELEKEEEHLRMGLNDEINSPAAVMAEPTNEELVAYLWSLPPGLPIDVGRQVMPKFPGFVGKAHLVKRIKSLLGKSGLYGAFFDNAGDSTLRIMSEGDLARVADTVRSKGVIRLQEAFEEVWMSV